VHLPDFRSQVTGTPSGNFHFPVCTFHKTSDEGGRTGTLPCQWAVFVRKTAEISNFVLTKVILRQEAAKQEQVMDCTSSRAGSTAPALWLQILFIRPAFPVIRVPLLHMHQNQDCWMRSQLWVVQAPDPTPASNPGRHLN
jgi:hypothetical protein